jgi:predicted phosphohydrolase
MGRWFALADLHLSEIGAKPMEIFGDLWRDHAARMARGWDETVGPDDVVLLPGDLSWGRNLAEAGPDIDWIGRRPGTKVLLRGNHDSWWTSATRVRAALPPGCEALHHDSLRMDGCVVVGTRGWTAPDDPSATEGDVKVFRRELDRLRLSIADADRRFGRTDLRIAMLHYPPWIVGRAPTEVVSILAEAGAKVCVFGHLHGEDHALAVTGEHDGIEFVLAAADAVGFTPVPIAPR